jgi:antirestriction protein ArdC
MLNGFGSEDYAREELVAELGAAFVCASLGISMEPRADHAHYLNGWMKKLSDHKREFVSAASAAAKAVDFLAAFSEEEVQVAQAA